MKRHRISNTELENLGKRMENSVGSVLKPQSSPLTTGRIIDSIFKFKGMDVDVAGKDYTTSSVQGYLEQSKIFTQDYLSALADPKKRSAAGKLKFMGLTEEAVRESAELIAQSENLDLSLLNKDVADAIYRNYRESAIHVENTFKRLGMPAISYPSESPYKHFLRYLIDPYAGTNPSEGIHPMVLNLMRTSYNPSHDAANIEDFSTGRNKMRSPFSLTRLHERSKKFFPEGVPTSLKEGSSRPMNHLGFDKGKTYTIITWDTETTGLTPESQIREIALVKRTVRYDDSGKMIVLSEPEIISSRSKSFGSKLMDIAGYVDEKGRSVPLSEAAFIAERGGIDKVDPAELAKFKSAFEGGGIEAVGEFKQILKYFLNEDNILGIEGGGIENLRIEGHNAESFDIDKFISTMDGLPAYHEDTEMKSLLKKFLRLRSEKANYVLDTLDSAKITFAIQQSRLSSLLADAGMSDELRTGLISSFSMSPEMFGGAKGSESLENIMLNTNFFELLEGRISADNSNTLINLMETRGTHTAEVDTMLNTYVSDFINSNELHIRRLPTAGMPPSGLSKAAADEYVKKTKTLEKLFKDHGFMKENRSMSAFEAFMRGRISRSSAVTPITNVSDLTRMSENVFKYLQTEAGSEKISLRVNANYLQRLKDVGDDLGSIDLGINLADPENEQSAAGRIFYNKKSKKFAFSNFEALGVGEDVPEGITKGYQELDTDLVRRAFNFTLDQAKDGGAGQVPILDSGRSVTVNAAKEVLANMSLTEIEATEIDQMMAARGVLSTLGRSTPLSTNASVLSQALGTTTEFYGKADGNFFPAYVGEHTTAYSKALLERGLPYATLDARSRILATAEAKATSGIGAKAIEILLNAGDDTYRGLGDKVTPAKIGKLSDIGLQFAISQGKEKNFGLKYMGKNEEVLNITDVNSYFRTPVSDSTGKTTKATRVIMSGDDINELVIREFDDAGKITQETNFGSDDFIKNADLNRFKDSTVQSNEINATINRAFAPKNLSEATTEDLAEQVLTLNTRAYKRLMDNKIRPHASLTDEAHAIAQSIFGSEGGSAEKATRLNQLQEMAQLSTRAERIERLTQLGADAGVGGKFVNNYKATIKTVAESIEEKYITGFKISGENAVREMIDARLAQGLSSETTDVALQGRTSSLVSTLSTKEQGVIGGIFSPSVTDDVDRGVRNLSGETLDVGVARAAENAKAHQAFIDSTSLIDDITEVLPGATDESKFVAQSIQKGRSLYAANKGKFALGALALAGAVTGYKMAKRGNENDLYSATMGQAPVEEGQRPYGIQQALMSNGQTSRRKDPLFTAGVVGNLDRQKIGHTSMGSNKNNHLFGDR